MRGLVASIAAKIALDVLRELAQALWNAFWGVVLDSVEEAEMQWVATGRGDLKKEWVIERAIAYLESMRKIGGIQRWALKYFLGLVVDAIINDLNDKLGKGWVSKVNGLKMHLAGKIPLVS